MRICQLSVVSCRWPVDSRRFVEVRMLRDSRIAERLAMAPGRSGRMLRVLALVSFVGSTLFSVAAWGGVEEGSESSSKVLTVCAIPQSMPRMGKTEEGKPEGLDIAVAKRLAGILKRPIEFHWCAECAMRVALPARRSL